jgi:hypothetical protein
LDPLVARFAVIEFWAGVPSSSKKTYLGPIGAEAQQCLGAWRVIDWALDLLGGEPSLITFEG